MVFFLLIFLALAIDLRKTRNNYIRVLNIDKDWKKRGHTKKEKRKVGPGIFSIFERRISLSINHTIISPDFQDFAEEIGEVKGGQKKKWEIVENNNTKNRNDDGFFSY